MTLRLWSASALVSLHKFFSCLKQFGYPSLAADYTLALSSLYGRSRGTARKTASPAGEAQRASNKREKRCIFTPINQLLCLYSRVSLEDSLGTAASIYAPRRLQLDRAAPGSVERPASL